MLNVWLLEVAMEHGDLEDVKRCEDYPNCWHDGSCMQSERSSDDGCDPEEGPRGTDNPGP